MIEFIYLFPLKMSYPCDIQSHIHQSRCNRCIVEANRCIGFLLQSQVLHILIKCFQGYVETSRQMCQRIRDLVAWQLLPFCPELGCSMPTFSQPKSTQVAQPRSTELPRQNHNYSQDEEFLCDQDSQIMKITVLSESLSSTAILCLQINNSVNENMVNENKPRFLCTALDLHAIEPFMVATGYIVNGCRQ